MLISVITPSYNRAYILKQCYESLVAQTDNDFEWIVVDDGSTDDTKELVYSFIDNNIMKIKYIYQENSGKHIAHNNAVLAAQGELTICLDSDDQLAPNAIERAKQIWLEKRKSDTIGIFALRGDLKKHAPICSTLPSGVTYSTMANLRDKYKFEGDTALFFRTDILKQNLFRKFEGEKFLPENNLYSDLDNIGTMILANEVLYYCEYHEDGLTAKYFKLLVENPKGTADTYYKMAIYAKTKIAALKYAIVAESYKSLASDTNELNFKKNKLLMFVAKMGVPFYKEKYINKWRKGE